MRWPLRNQILLPMFVLTLTSLLLVSALNAFLALRRTRARIENDLRSVTQTLTTSTFPLSSSVLKKMRGLAGAEFVLTDQAGNVRIASVDFEISAPLPTKIEASESLSLGEPLTVNERRYFHSSVHVPQATGTLHILYPESSYRQAYREVVYPPMVVGAVATLLVVGISLGIASRVARPLRNLQTQVERIATGEFRAIPVPRRNDEIADLSSSVNRMAEMLAKYETEVRRNERLRTLDQLSGGIAHQMRNSVAGCRMAVELHARKCTLECDSLDVALRQFGLMENFLQRFLELGKASTAPHAMVDLRPVVENVMSLVRPAALHVGVDLRYTPPHNAATLQGDKDALEQLLVNLVVNGIEAAAGQDSTVGGGEKFVAIELEPSGESVRLVVSDSGPGPADDVRDALFEPFITEKPDGTGLGLAVACEIVEAHAGKIDWQRVDGATRFSVEFPQTDQEMSTDSV